MYVLKSDRNAPGQLLGNQALVLPPSHQLGGFNAISNTKDAPWRWVCSIYVSFPKKVYPAGISRGNRSAKDARFGTGVLISPRHVLTVAHNILGLDSRNRRIEPSRIEISPGRNDAKFRPNQFGTYRHRRYFIPQKFSQRATSHQGAPFDIALIELRSKPGNKKKLGWWGRESDSALRRVTGTFRAHLKTRQVCIAGYPYSKDSEEFTEYSTPAGLPYHDFGYVHSLYPNMLTYCAWGESGMSGGPVWIENKSSGQRYLVGIHQGRNLFASGTRQGTLLRPNVIDWLKAKVGSSLRVV
ncbi:MAG: trypsin-like peptidase domain-containing protein [Cyanobacteria bacterium P01_F01_bin.53]